MITIVNYNVGNLLSLRKMIEKVGGEVSISSQKKDILSAEKLILPGVGAFDYGMSMLNDMGLSEILEEAVIHQKKPILGICLGMQLFCRKSEEGKIRGLGWIPADVVKFDSQLCKVPHMGWNYISLENEGDLFTGSHGSMKYYFVHSYHVVPDDPKIITSTAYHSLEFAASIQKDNIYATQFHPEKSLKYGMTLIKNFVEM